MSTGLAAIYTREEMLSLLTEARSAYHKLATEGAVQEVRTIDRLTRFHPVDAAKLLAWIRELEAALGIMKRAQSRPVYF